MPQIPFDNPDSREGLPQLKFSASSSVDIRHVFETPFEEMTFAQLQAFRHWIADPKERTQLRHWLEENCVLFRSTMNSIRMADILVHADQDRIIAICQAKLLMQMTIVGIRELNKSLGRDGSSPKLELAMRTLSHQVKANAAVAGCGGDEFAGFCRGVDAIIDAVTDSCGIPSGPTFHNECQNVPWESPKPRENSKHP